MKLLAVTWEIRTYVRRNYAPKAKESNTLVRNLIISLEDSNLVASSFIWILERICRLLLICQQIWQRLELLAGIPCRPGPLDLGRWTLLA
jgi:hypothetical protein